MDKCTGKCDEHGGLSERVAVVDAKLIILMVMIGTLIAGTGYSIFQNHRVDNRMITIASLVKTNTTQQELTMTAFNIARDSHQARVVSLDKEINSIAVYCCDELGTFGWESNDSIRKTRGK